MNILTHHETKRQEVASLPSGNRADRLAAQLETRGRRTHARPAASPKARWR